MPSMALAQGYDNSPILLITPAESAKASAPANPATASPVAAAPAATPASPAPVSPAANASPALPVTPPLPPNFPEWAVSNAAQNTAGNTNPVVASPISPATPSTPAAVTAERAPFTPPAPSAPESPVSKLWPSDTVPIFVKSCVGFHVELIPACGCVITELMASMPHDEFLKLSETGAIESDPRLKHARLDCVAAPARKD